MLKNYFLVAVRNLQKYKFFSLLNILGLALGMGCSLLILLWVNDERSVDGFHAHSDRLFIVYQRQFFDKKVEGQYATTGRLDGELKRTIPEIQYAAAIRPISPGVFRSGNKILKETSGDYANADFFHLFSYPLLQGNAASALSTGGIAISKKMADDFFGSPEQAMGKMIRFNDKKDLQVTGVFADLPTNVTDHFDFLLYWPDFLARNEWAGQWGNYGNYTCIRLRDDANPAAVEKKLTHFMDRYDAGQTAGYKIELGMQRFSEVYLHGDFKEGKPGSGRIQYVYLFSIVAAFILLIACINFMNLTTARSTKRAKEIGIRKVVGAFRFALIVQFIGEALLLAILSAGIALLMVSIALPWFNQLTGKNIQTPFHHLSFWASMAGLTVVTGIVSGSYPAFLLSSFKPIRVLKGSVMQFSAMGTWLRKGLVVFQFVLSIGLIIATLVVSEQIQFIQSGYLGYDRENLVYVPLEGDLSKKYEVFRTAASGLPGVLSASRISQSPTTIDDQTFMVDWSGKEPNSQVLFVGATVGYDFVRTMKLQLVAGRDFTRGFSRDSAGYIINETALRKIGYKNPIGQPLSFWGNKGAIVGVLKDFHFNSLHEAIEPLVLRMGEASDGGYLLLRIAAGKSQEAIAGLKTLCRQLNPEFPFNYSFSDEEFRQLYKSDEVVGDLSRCFAGLAIFICCLGLLGLALFVSEQRSKEIGIRKVLGASIPSLLRLLSTEFVVLTLLGFLIAAPLACWAMTRWLADFAYHISLNGWIFIIAGAAATIITLATVSIQAMKAALANPAKTLRSE